jgi:colanic acid biosynthesis glycosyl transferase WcaI
VTKRIWVLTELYFPEQSSTGYLLTRIAEGLAKRFSVNIITGLTIHSNCEARPNFEIVHNVSIFRCQGTQFHKDLIAGRLINILTRSLTIFLKALFFCKSQDVILVVTNPPLLPFMALLLKWIKGCEFVLLIHDVYPEVLVATGLVKQSSPIIRILQVCNQVLYRQALRIITLGRDMTQLAIQKIEEIDLKHKIVCIPNWADIDTVQPISKIQNVILEDLNISNCFTILYAGNMGRTHDIESLVEAAKALSKVVPPIQFIFIGSGAKQRWLSQALINHQLTNVTILPFRPSHEKSISLNACDVAVISFVRGMAGVSVPSRMYNQMAAGKPIIAMADVSSELAQVILEEQIGWVVQPGDVQGLIKAIQTASAHPDLCTEMGKRAAIAAQTKYSYAQSSRAYNTLFDELLNLKLPPKKTSQN